MMHHDKGQLAMLTPDGHLHPLTGCQIVRLGEDREMVFILDGSIVSDEPAVIGEDYSEVAIWTTSQEDDGPTLIMVVAHDEGMSTLPAVTPIVNPDEDKTLASLSESGLSNWTPPMTR